jgi:hypothetical protein
VPFKLDSNCLQVGTHVFCYHTKFDQLHHGLN